MSSARTFDGGDFALCAQGLSKRYRLYKKPSYRLLDLFGLCPADADYYTEHVALEDFDLTIQRGEKVAIIGRNGAGKSTLLKMITGLVRPTAGTVDVRGGVSNLLQLGAGFHPDFTGRQNVYAGLAHQGVTGREATKLFAEIVAFAEIEEYIDQPMKTYSTGMCSRLMFSSSIVLKPDILVVDEILGVGDAYFAHKSFERMRELCTRDATTLLLVTHDIYSALNLCDRFIWIDRGQLRFDGSGKDAIGMYERSVKEQQEEWLRQQNAASMRERVGADVVHVVLQSRTGFALDRPLAIGSLQLASADGRALTIEVANGDEHWHLVAESNLSDPEDVLGRRCRSLRTSGSIYHKAEWTVALPLDFEFDRVHAEWLYRGDDHVELRVVTTDRKVLADGELASGAGWQTGTFDRVRAGRQQSDAFKQVDYGTGVLRITQVEFLDQDGAPVAQVRFGDALTVRLHCRIDAPLVSDAVTVVIGFARQGSAYQNYIYDPHLHVPERGSFIIDSCIDNVRLGSGAWYVNLGIGEADMFKRTTLPYFSVDSAWYHLMSARLQLHVLSATQFDANGCFFAVPASITVVPERRAEHVAS